MKTTSITRTLIIPAALIILGFSSCRKEMVDLNRDKVTIDGSNTVKLSEDELLRKVTINIPAQNVKTSVSGNVLTMVYTEDVSAVLDPNGYDLSYSVRFNEDFSGSALSKFSYTVPAPNGSYTTDWAGNDLKVLNEVTKSNVVIDGKSMLSLRLVRQFTFTKSYNNIEEALNQQNILLNTKTDVVKFNAYVVFGKEYPATSASAKLVYTK